MQRLSSLWTTRKGDWLPFTFHWNLRHQMWKWRRLEFLERLNPLKGSWKVCGETQLSGWWGRPEFQEAFPKAFRTFSSSHNRWSYFKQATPRWMQGNRCENVLWGWLGSEEGAYTLHWQAELPGGLGGLGGPGTPRTFLNNWLEPFAYMQYMYIQCQSRLIYRLGRYLKSKGMETCMKGPGSVWCLQIWPNLERVKEGGIEGKMISCHAVKCWAGAVPREQGAAAV